MTSDSIQPPASKGAVIDAKDKSILGALSVDARLTLADLASRVDLSVSAVHGRIRRLEQQSVILGYRAIIAPEAVGRDLTAFVEITPIDPAQADDSPERLSTVAAVEACYSIAGSANYLLLVRVETPRRLEELIAEIRQIASVATRTTIVLHTYYEHRPLVTGDLSPKGLDTDDVGDRNESADLN